MAENDNRDDDLKDEDLVVEETDETDWKAEAEKLRDKAIRQRERTRLLRDQLKQAQAQKPPEQAPIEKKEFDDIDHLFLDVKGVPQEDREYLWGEVKETGKSLRGLLNLRYIQDGLKERAQARASEAALPGGNNRSGTGTAKDDPEYWLAKIDSGQTTLMAVPSRELRSKIVEIRKQRDQQGPRFTDNPIV